MTSNYSLRNNLSWGSSYTGGLAAASGLAGSAPSAFLNSSAASILGQPSMGMVNDQPEQFENQRITVPVRIKALQGDYQRQYKESTLLFTMNAENDVQDDQYTSLSLPVLNFALESAARNRAASSAQMGSYVASAGSREREALVDSRGSLDGPGSLKRRMQQQSDPYASMPITAEEFGKRIQFLGVFWTSNDKSVIPRERNVGVAMDGKIKLPNLWPGAQVGDFVGLKVTQVPAYSSTFLMGLDGKAAASGGTPVPFLQVTPCWTKECNQPLLFTDFKAPRPQDICYLEPTYIVQKEYPKDPRTKLTRFDATPIVGKDSPLSASLFTQGHYIPIGFVKHYAAMHSSVDDVTLALRSQVHWENLLTQCPIEIHMKANAQSRLDLV